MIVVCAAKSDYTWDSTESPDELYIVIGNGFDKACGLPTGYSDFLREVKTAEVVHDHFKKMRKAQRLYETWKDKCAEPTRYYLPLINNSWYRLFNYNRSKVQKNDWVDFEKEVTLLITSIETNMDTHGLTELDRISLKDDPDLTNDLKAMLLTECPPVRRWSINHPFCRKYIRSYKELNIHLAKDFEYLRNALWHYLKFNSQERRLKESDGVNEIISKIGSAINENISTFVISFNYTDTLEQILKNRGIKYDKKQFCYIHGKLGSTMEQNTMVLGMGGDYPDVNELFLEFRKENQRNKYNTDPKYLGWIEDFKKKRNRNKCRELIIFGHSLSVTDKYVISELIEANNMRTKIYYYDGDSKTNMTKELSIYMKGKIEDLRGKGKLDF